MTIRIKDRAELKRLRKLLTNLDNKTVDYPLMIYCAEDQTVAFMTGNGDREFSVKTEGKTQHFTMSDRKGARTEWVEAEVEDMKEKVEALTKRRSIGAIR